MSVIYQPLLGCLWGEALLLSQVRLRFETQLAAEESAFNRAARAGSTTNQSRWVAKSARWDGLTFDTKGENIVWSSGSHFYPARRLDVVLPLLRIHLS